jgi:glycosyl transferase family 25
MKMKFIDYFDRISIIHLPERADRYEALERELKSIDIDVKHPKVRIPFAPRPDDACGFTSKGVYGNFLSHYNILKEALDDKLGPILVLEDDAIFSRRMAREQEQLVHSLGHNPWDICFLGHSLNKELKGLPHGLIPHSAEFRWAHCYAVHPRILPRLVTYLEANAENPAGHPRGGKMYIDGCYNLFRRFNPDVVALVSNPVLSVQKGSPSSLNNRPWYEGPKFGRMLVGLGRSVRDELWRRTGLHYPPIHPR